jgi:hypothetical protein
MNCGAVVSPGAISPARRELPYSGGRIVNGGIGLSIVDDEGAYQHMAYAETKNDGKVVASGEALPLLPFGSANGERLSMVDGAAEPSMAAIRGKDTGPFVRELFTWLL